MNSLLIFRLLRLGSKVLFYLLVIYTVVFIITSLLRISGKNKQINEKVFTYEALSFSPQSRSARTTTAETNNIKLRPSENRYSVMVRPDSKIGYYAFWSKLIFTCLGIAILWIFKRIFEQANMELPFRKSIYKLLLALAVAFAAADVLASIDYLLVNHLLTAELPAMKLSLITDIGQGIVTAVIILAIASIYQRGIVIQEENELTV